MNEPIESFLQDADPPSIQDPDIYLIDGPISVRLSPATPAEILAAWARLEPLIKTAAAEAP